MYTNTAGPFSELGMDLLWCSRLRIASREDVPDSNAAVIAKIILWAQRRILDLLLGSEYHLLQ